MPTGHGGSVDGARIEWHRRSGKNAIEAKILATGENGLHDATQANGWFRTQLVDGLARHHAATGSDRHRNRPQDAFVVTYRETWS